MRAAARAKQPLIHQIEEDLKLRPKQMAQMLGLNYQRYLDLRMERQTLQDYHKAMLLLLHYSPDSTVGLLQHDSANWDSSMLEAVMD